MAASTPLTEDAMLLENIHKAEFIARPNRFVAHARLKGEVVVCHVKNTGRCKELLTPGCTVLLSHQPHEHRKTQWDLVAAYKGRRLIHMDSQAPNRIAREWLQAGGLGFAPENLRPEYRHGDSRFDFYFEHGGRPCLMEVKGVTLEDGGVVRFPDAPTERGLKHLRGLTAARTEGYDCYVLFIIQMQDVLYLEPNRRTHPAFAEALAEAEKAGVKLLALDCEVKEDSIRARMNVPIRLEE